MFQEIGISQYRRTLSLSGHAKISDRQIERKEFRRSFEGNYPKRAGFDRSRRSLPFRAEDIINHTPMEWPFPLRRVSRETDGRIQKKARGDEKRVGKGGPCVDPQLHFELWWGPSTSFQFQLLPAYTSATSTVARFIIRLATLAIARLILIDSPYITSKMSAQTVSLKPFQDQKPGTFVSLYLRKLETFKADTITAQGFERRLPSSSSPIIARPSSPASSSPYPR